MTEPTELHISRDMTLPLNAVTQTFAFIARRGAGKTYAASKLAEQMLTAHMQIIVLDPVGNWYGLRLAADGKSRGFEIPVFGGEHGDLPLAVGAGALIADLVVDRRISVVLDLSSFRKGERKTFVTDFAEQFFHRKKTARTPVHVFVEEAQVFVPERPAKGEERMLGAFVDLVRLGRNYGIGVSLISQRPQSVSKEALNQTEALLVLQTGGAHERKALADWIVYQGIESKAVLDDVPSLPAGTAYLWSPQWLGVLKKIKIAKKVTFDASATPEMGAVVVEPKTLAPVDLEAIRAAMKTVVAEAEAKDPAKLRARIAELERQLKAAPKAAPAAPRVEVKETRIEVPVFKDGEVARLETAITNLGIVGGQLVTAGNQVKSAADEIGERLALFNNRPAPPRPQIVTTTRTTTPARAQVAPRAPRRTSGESQPAGDIGRLPQGERIILEALIQYPEGLRREQLTVLTGYKRSSRDAYIQRLRERGYASTDSERVTATDEGIAALPDARPLPTGQALREFWQARLPQGERVIFDVIVARYPDAVDRNELDEATGYKRSSRDAYLMRLAAKELITVARGMVRASDSLFEME